MFSSIKASFLMIIFISSDRKSSHEDVCGQVPVPHEEKTSEIGEESVVLYRG